MITDPAGSEGLRYQPLTRIAAGGMGTVFVGVVRGALGFRQLVAIKRPHDFLTDDPGFRRALLVEARLASLVRHANVIDVRDVEVVGDSIQLVMDYVEGATLAELIAPFAKTDVTTRASLAMRIILDACAGLHAIHETKDESGRWLGLVHRDVSPQNVLIGMDGIARVADFGLAKSAQSGTQATASASLRGKLGYMAPELLRGRPFDRRVDIFAMGVVAWEALAARRLFRGESDADAMHRVLHEPAPSLASIEPELGSGFDAAIAAATTKGFEERLATIDTFATMLESGARAAGLVASHADVARFVVTTLAQRLDDRRSAIRAELERLERSGVDGSVSASSGAGESAEPERPARNAAAGSRATRRARGRLILAFAAMVIVGLVASAVLPPCDRAARPPQREPVASQAPAVPAPSVSDVTAVAPSASSQPSATATAAAVPGAAIDGSFPRSSSPPPTRRSATPVPTAPTPKLRPPPPNPY